MIIENTPILETKRLILRKFTQSDLPAYFDIMSEEKANTYLPWFTPKTMEEAEALLYKKCLGEYEKPSAYKYAVCLKENNIPIGYCGLSGTESSDIGYNLREAFWHRGIITEAASAMVQRIKNAGYAFITATHDVNNPRSGEVMKKLGMSYRYSYLEKWQPKDILVTFRMFQLNFDSGAQTYMGYWDNSTEPFIEQNI